MEGVGNGGKQGKALIVIGIILLIIVITAVIIILKFTGGTSAVAAELREVQGEADVSLAGKDFIKATAGTKLKQGDAVRTKDGQATIIFFGASIMRLDKNTEIEIAGLNSAEASVKITQESGHTWNRVVKAGGDENIARVTGVKGLSSYEVVMPGAVATVRGTSFAVYAEEKYVLILRGTVKVGTDKQQKDVKEQKVAIVDGEIVVRDIPLDTWIQQNIAKDEEFDQNLLAELRRKYKSLIEIIKKKYGFTDEQIDAAILDYLRRGGGPLPKEAEQVVSKDSELQKAAKDEVTGAVIDTNTKLQEVP